MTLFLRFIFLALLASPAVAEVSDRRMVFIRPSIGEVFLQYVFSVNETAETARTIEIPLPENTIDFILQEGVEKSDAKLGEQGQLILQKSFPAGGTIVSVLFKVRSENGEASIRWKAAPGRALETLFLTADSQLRFSGIRELTGNENPFGRNYRAFAPENSENMAFQIHDLPTSRKVFWMIGLAAALLLIGASAMLTVQLHRKTAPIS